MTKEKGTAKYRAVQVPGTVVVIAEGMNPTPGYKNWFEASLIDVYPPEFTLFREAPQGFQVQILAYFCCWAQFNASRPVEFVVVHDAGGPKRVKVDQAHDLAEAKPGQGTEWVLCSGGWVSSG